MSEALSPIVFVYALAIALGAALLIKLIAGALAQGKHQPELPSAPVVEAGIPAHHVVLIAAAAHAMMGAHRILHIGAAASGGLWSTEGRMAQHSSHHPSHH